MKRDATEIIENRGNSFSSFRWRPAVFAILPLLSIACACSTRPGGDAKKAPVNAPQEFIEASATVDSSGKPLGKEAVNLMDGNVRIWYADLGDALGIRVFSPGTVIIHADVNQNASVDRMIDKTFGILENGTLCVQFEHDKSDSSNCGEVASSAKSSVSISGEQRDTLWKIPKAEFGPGGRAAFVSFEIYDPHTTQSTFVPGPPFTQIYKLRFGKAAVVDSAGVASFPVRQSQAVKPPAAKPVPVPVVPAPVSTPVSSPQPPVITWFTAEPDHVAIGESVRLAWSVANAANVTIEPGIGVVTPSDQRSERPSANTTYTLTAIGTSGAVQTKTLKIEVLEPVEIRRFYLEKPVVFLDDTIVLIWQTKGAAEVTIGLFDKPEGSREQFPPTPQMASGRLEIPVSRDQFTRYGNYEFQLVAKGLQGPVSKNVKVYLRQR